MSAIDECAPSPENCAECPKAATCETALKNLSLDAPAADEAPGVSSPEKTAEPEAISPERTGKDKKTRRRRGNKKPDAAPAAEAEAAPAAPVDVKALLAKRGKAGPKKTKKLSDAQKAVLSDAQNKTSAAKGGKRLSGKAYSEATYASGANGWAC